MRIGSLVCSNIPSSSRVYTIPQAVDEQSKMTFS